MVETLHLSYVGIADWQGVVGVNHVSLVLYKRYYLSNITCGYTTGFLVVFQSKIPYDQAFGITAYQMLYRFKFDDTLVLMIVRKAFEFDFAFVVVFVTV